MDKRELSTILAALRFWQAKTAAEWSPELSDICTDGGTLEPLSPAEIDTLCYELQSR